MTRYGSVEYEVVEHVARVTMDRPEKRNGERRDARRPRRGVRASAIRTDVHAVVLAGNGPSFCSGYDLGGSRYATPPDGGWDLGNTVATLRTIEAGYQRIWNFAEEFR